MVPGSDRAPRSGFTLVELLVVLVLIGLASGLAGLALRQGDASRLEREAERLGALLEAARAEARAAGAAVRFELTPAADAEGPYRFVGLVAGRQPPGQWLEPGTTARIDTPSGVLRLGPEPMIGRQRIVLRLGEHQAVVGTDGLSPFALLGGVSSTEP